MNNTDTIRAYLSQGKSYDYIAKHCNCTKATISYHAGKIGLGTPRKTIDWDQVQDLYDTGVSITECAETLGIARSSCSRAVKAGKIQLRNRKLLSSDILIENSSTTRKIVKSHLLREGILKNKCSECEQTESWNGKPLVMVLDHINGVNNDNRLENLRMLCPNCNSQMDTFAGRNSRRK